MNTPGKKAKTIKSIIHRKINAWIGTIEDEKLRKRVEGAVIVTGGSIASMLLGEPVSDYDVYFRDFETAKAVCEYYVARFKSGREINIRIEEGKRIKIVVVSDGVAGALPERDEDAEPPDVEDAEAEALKTETAEGKKKEYKPIFVSTNAITLSDKIQIVVRFYGEPDDIHDNYDFVHCTNYWSSWDNKLVLRPAALEALLTQELRYVGSKYPICSLIRLRKFIGRGWRINAGQILKMAMQISKLDLANLKVLEDQLTGVDTAYFLQLIDQLKEHDPASVDVGKLCELIDRIF